MGSRFSKISLFVFVDDTVVVFIQRLTVGKIDKQTLEIDHTSDKEPNRAYRRNDTGNDQAGDEEVPVPPVGFPRAEIVPEDDQEEGEDEPVDEGVAEHAVRDDTVTLGVLGSNSDQT